MKWWSVRILSCLLLGLLATVAVAWTSAALEDVTPTGMPLSAADNAGFTVPVHHSWAVQFAGERVGVWLFPGSYAGPLEDYPAFEIDAARTTLASLDRAGVIPAEWGRTHSLINLGAFPSNAVEWNQDARGWPLRALWCEWVDNQPGSPHGARGGIDLWPRYATGGTPPRALPFRPIPIGLAADTLFYAAILAAIFVVPGRIRGAIRVRRGLCLACGYDQSGLTPGAACPECGNEGPARSSDAAIRIAPHPTTLKPPAPNSQ